jgi:zinc transport system permease protein
MSYLFGNILLVSPDDLWLIAGLDAVVVGCSVLCYNQLLAISFDEEYARLRGLCVPLYYLLLLALTALTIVLLVQVVGVVLVIALLTLPAAAAAAVTRRLWQTMALATLLALGCTTGGLAISYAPNLPAGATIILLAGAVYLLIVLPPWRWLGRTWRRPAAE